MKRRPCLKRNAPMRSDLLSTPDASLSDQDMVAKVAMQEANEFDAMRADWKIRAARRVFQAGSKYTPNLMVSLVRLLFEKPKRYKAPERERELLARAKAFQIPTRHGLVQAWEWGEGPAVHLVHGWEGRGAQLGAIVDPLVERGFRVVTWDAPAHGQSPGFRASAMSFGHVVRDVAKELGMPFAVYAHSMGAIAVSVAIQEGYAPERFVYISPGTAPDKPLRMVEQVLGVSSEVMQRFQTRMEELFGMDWERIRDGALPEGFAPPLLMIHDRGDREVSFRTAERLQRNWPGSKLEFTNGLGHNRILRDEDVLARAVAFIAETQAAD